MRLHIVYVLTHASDLDTEKVYSTKRGSVAPIFVGLDEAPKISKDLILETYKKYVSTNLLKDSQILELAKSEKGLLLTKTGNNDIRLFWKEFKTDTTDDQD